MMNDEKRLSKYDPIITWNIKRAIRLSRTLPQAEFTFKGLQWDNGMGTTMSDFEMLRIEFKKVNG